mmetsp:Transcript_3014/g.8206  ORF Transcript_3014/g.8206 Transcript_3014/m.8206 type:complete len:322 (+) Transcript_3014:2006-2971(+)
MREPDVLGVDARRQPLGVHRFVQEDLRLVVGPGGVGDQRVPLGPREAAVGEGVPVDPVNVVADDRVPEGRQVDVDLVVPPRDAGQGDPCDGLPPEELPGHHLVLGDAVLGSLEDLLADVLGRQIHQRPLVVVRRDANVGRASVVPHDGQVDDPIVPCDVPRHQRLVPAIDLALPEDAVELPDRVLVLGHDHQPGRVHPQPVDDHVVGVRQILGFDFFEDGLRQGGVVFLPGNRQDARRLVDDQNILVLVNNYKIFFFEFLGRLVLEAQFCELLLQPGVDVLRGDGTFVIFFVAIDLDDFNLGRFLGSCFDEHLDGIPELRC